MQRPRVLIADDHRIVGEGLRSLLTDDFDLVGIAEDGRDLVAKAKALSPDVVITDISMPNLGGIDALEQLKRNQPAIKVVFLTMHQDPAYARRAIAAGADGFVVKHSAAGELVMAVRAALKGETFISPSVTSLLLRDRKGGIQAAEPVITARQREILKLVAH